MTSESSSSGVPRLSVNGATRGTRMATDMGRPENTVKTWCNNCRSVTLHSVDAEHGVKVPGMMIHGQEMHRHEHYMVVTCQGCQEIHFLKVRMGSEDMVWLMGYEHPFDSPDLQSSYPPRNFIRAEPEWVAQLDPNLNDLMNQTYMALHVGADRLVAMGTRAALEYTIIDKCGDEGTFRKNVSQFKKEGYLPQANCDAVIAALDVGSAAIHRGYKPDLEAIVDVFEIVESVIHSVYIVPNAGARRSETTPRRIGKNDLST